MTRELICVATMKLSINFVADVASCIGKEKVLKMTYVVGVLI